MKKPLPVLIVASAAFLWSCGDNTAPVPETTASAETPPAKPRAEQALLDDLAVANRILAKELAILDVQGHVTARSLVNPNHYYIARFIAPGGVTTGDFIENDLDSKPVDGPRNDQAREIYLHGDIYKARPDVMAVVHAHTPEFVAFGLSSVPLWEGDAMLPVFDLRPFNRGRAGIISTPALGKAMAEKMGKSEAVLLWGHGIALGAKSIAEAITRVSELRDAARAQQATIAAGGTWKPHSVTVDADTTRRTWAYYKDPVIKDMGGKVLMTAPPSPAKPSDPLALAKHDVVLANHILASDEVGVLGALGTLSVRNPNNPNSYLIAPNVAAGAVTASDVIERDVTKAEPGPAELAIHDEVYKTHPEVKAVLFARTPDIVALSGSVPLRAAVNGGNFIGEGLPTVNNVSGAAVAMALDKKGGILLSGQGIVLTAGSIYTLTDRAYQVRQNAKIQLQAQALRGKVMYLADLPAPAGSQPEPPAPAQGAQQLGPPEGRGWVYWADEVSR
jgi:ribulose-5-phosphate 4-epimerase/fuculose-1-phosphate aldolase